LANNDFKITKINDLESLKYISFVKDELIKRIDSKKDSESIRTFGEDQPRTTEYPDIMAFKDQA
jgi:hypothetical protein